MFSKHVLGPLVILVRFLPVLLSMPQRGDLCPNFPIGEHSRIVLHINQTTGEHHCCKQVFCRAGTEVQYCSRNNPNTTWCRDCAHGYYSPDNQHSFNNPKCLPWKQCNEKLGLVFNNDGDKISEGSCSCDVAKGFYSDKWGDCQMSRVKCDPDHELNGKTGRCERCRDGYQQPEKGYGPCKECPAETQKVYGQLNCTRCPEGTFKPDKGYGACLTCAELIAKGRTDTGCDPKQKSTPKIGASSDEDQQESSPTVMIAVLTVLGILALLIVLLVSAAVVHRRRKMAASRQKKMSSPTHGPKPLGHNYRSVPDTSSNSSDISSHSSAEDAIEAEKVKAQNAVNQKSSVVDEKKGVTLDEINTDAPPAGVHGPPPSQPAGFPQGQFGKPQEQGGFLIVNPTNCNISFGNSNELHNTPVANHTPVPQGGQLNDLNTPNGVPTVNLTNNNQGSPAYVNKMASDYYDDADRIDAYYNGRSEC